MSARIDPSVIYRLVYQAVVSGCAAVMSVVYASEPDPASPTGGVFARVLIPVLEPATRPRGTAQPDVAQAAIIVLVTAIDAGEPGGTSNFLRWTAAAALVAATLDEARLDDAAVGGGGGGTDQHLQMERARTIADAPDDVMPDRMTGRIEVAGSAQRTSDSTRLTT